MAKLTKAQQETHTIQTWPGGASFEYRGDPDGPTNQKSLRAGHWQASQPCPATCRRVTLSMLPAGVDDDPRLGRYVVPTTGNDWTTGAEICATCKGEGYIRNPARNPWRPGTAEEWRTIRIALRAEMYQARDIRRNVCALVTDLMEAANSGELRGDLAEGFGYDAIRNLYKDPSDWGVEQCRDYIRDHGDEADVDAPNPWTMDRAALVDALTEAGIECRDDESDETLREAMIVNLDDETIAGLDTWREAARELAQDNPAEVYEWYLVDSWLCGQLHAIGEVTIDNGYGEFWGRTCTGQALIMDGTLQEIAARFERAE